MKIEINGNEVRIIGNNGCDLRVYFSESKGIENFFLSLCYGGFEHGCLPMTEIYPDRRIVVTNNMEKGVQILK